MAKRRRNWDWPRISGGFVLLFAPARADARFARTKGDYVRMLLQCLLGIAALLLPRVMSPAFVALFTFCFALALDVLWEIYEFTVDALFQTNMQKYALEGGEALAGQAALQDTMGDLIVDFIGALGIAIAAPSPARAGRGTGAQGRSATRGGRGQTARALLLFCPQRSSILRARSSVTGSTRAQMRQPASPYSSSSTDPYLCRKETTSPRS